MTTREEGRGGREEKKKKRKGRPRSGAENMANEAEGERSGGRVARVLPGGANRRIIIL